MVRAQFAEALQAFVDASVDGGDWRAPLSRAQDAMGVRAVILHGHERFAGERSSVFETSTGLPAESIDLYQRHYINVDVRADIGVATGSGVVLTDERLGDLRDVDRSEVYAELFRPYDIGRFVGVRLGAPEQTPEGERNLYLTVLRTNEAEADAALNNQALTLAHVVRGALRSAAAFAALRAESDAKSAALDSAPFGWILLGDNQRIVHMNATAAAILERSDGLCLHAGRLAAGARHVQGAIERATARSEEIIRPPQILSLPRPEPQRPYVLMLTPLRHDIGAWLAGGVRTAAALFIIDPDSGGQARDALWRAAFRLTDTEIRIARLLVQGASKDEIATARGVALATVQTQMKQMYVKLGVNSQAQAAALLLRSAPFIA
jgi:DNA-binding CsgD family transcriptional regulator